MQKERFDFPGSQLHREDISDSTGCMSDVFPDRGKSWNGIFGFIVTTSEVTLQQGQTSVDALVECQTEGSRGNLACSDTQCDDCAGPSGITAGKQSGARFCPERYTEER